MRDFYYYVFCLGYDILHDDFDSREDNECDVVFEKAEEIVRGFWASEEYKDMTMSGYDALHNYVHNKRTEDK